MSPSYHAICIGRVYFLDEYFGSTTRLVWKDFSLTGTDIGSMTEDGDYGRKLAVQKMYNNRRQFVESRRLANLLYNEVRPIFEAKAIDIREAIELQDEWEVGQNDVEAMNVEYDQDSDNHRYPLEFLLFTVMRRTDMPRRHTVYAMFDKNGHPTAYHVESSGDNIVYCGNSYEDVVTYFNANPELTE